VATGFDADLKALQDFVTNFMDIDDLEAKLTKSYAVVMPDFGQGVTDFTDGVNIATTYGLRINNFNASAKKLIAEVRSLKATVKWIGDQYQNAQNEDVVGAADVDRQYNAGSTGPTG
jgi:hypothetical protein